MTDIEIAGKAKPQPILKIAAKLGLSKKNIELYGNIKAKINYTKYSPKAKLILVTAINPTPAGEGKTTLSIGLTDALNKIGKNACVALREPSLGPVFGVKGGAAGGGYSQVIPMEDINLHFTGDLHAVTSANNLLSAIIDNHIHSGNALNIHPKKIMWRRCVDLNDRALRNVALGLGGTGDGVMRGDGFYITAASEVMAILCLSASLDDLKKRLGDILVAYTYTDTPVYAKDLKANDAMAILLRDALKPNLAQTLEGNPAFIHGGPFANIAHGASSITATKLAMTFADYVVTEAGFGADLGAEKFLHVKCRENGIAPSCCVIVATVRALKCHGGVKKENLSTPDEAAVKRGMANLTKHIENITGVFGLKAVVAINKFSTDSLEELNAITDGCAKLGVDAIVAEVHAKGGDGGRELAQRVSEICDANPNPKINFAYEKTDSVKEKITKVCTKIYGADGAAFSPKAMDDIDRISKAGYADLPVIMAKTQYSLSDDPKLTGRPAGFTVNIREVQLRAGSRFLVVIAGDIMLMPGLPKIPASENMKISSSGKITGLF